MPLTPAQISLVEAANRTIDAIPRGTPTSRMTDHTVGCAALSSDGRIFTGINMFHPSGGPCAENIAVVNAAAAGVSSSQNPGFPIGDGATTAAKLTTIVAVANEGRGVISPCGRCRQMMSDYYPDIEVIIKDGEELRTAGVKELLPFAYVSRKFATGQHVSCIHALAPEEQMKGGHVSGRPLGRLLTAAKYLQLGNIGVVEERESKMNEKLNNR